MVDTGRSGRLGCPGSVRQMKRRGGVELRKWKRRQSIDAPAGQKQKMETAVVKTNCDFGRENENGGTGKRGKPDLSRLSAVDPAE